ncbi:uncharacterized protein BKA55DRAFT_584297 [Fusarium redolens]|uniref:Rhodopsin domain-containing protein n=1 Tax=Fusarium redolens TaxID=48865 RepID=A0A9P9JLW1_FUSRE|nr:uncharacterized protein BKA55DRAFT_584297 [Fusarium redolens]KAH7227216.1 hypothetical protein BKA55DRAFT_584297 [Fusarium redolens]
MAVHAPTPTAVLISEWLLLSIAAAMILARLWLRIRINRQRLLLSDVFICLAWFSAVASASVDVYLKCVGILRQDEDAFLQIYDGDPKTRQSALLYFWAGTFAFFTAFWCSKMAILAFYLQVFPPVFRIYRIIIWLVIAYSASGYIVAMALNLFLCWPLQRNWATDQTACIAEIQVKIGWRVGWALHFSSDVIIFVLPFMILRNLRMDKLVRFGVYCTFGLGAINIIFCLVRFLVVEASTDIDNGKMVPLTLLELWSSTDCNISVIIACMPALRPYLRLIHARYGRTISSGPTSSPRGPRIVPRAHLDTLELYTVTRGVDWERELPADQANTSGEPGMSDDATNVISNNPGERQGKHTGSQVRLVQVGEL